MLIGEYTHTIDDKHRLSLPAKFRASMGKKVVLTPGLDKCIFIFTTREWQRISNRLAESSMLNADSRSFNRFLLGGAVEADVDKIGRILLPDFLISRAGLSDKVVLIGVNTRVEIWNVETWQAYRTNVESQADSLADKLSQVGML